MTQPQNLSDEVNALKSKGMLKRVAKATVYSIQGFKAAWRYEAAFRTELLLAIFFAVLALLTPLTFSERFVLIGCWVFVLIVELLNSAIETVVDLASPELHPLAGRAKDLASAAVMASLVFTLAVWGCIAVPAWCKILLA